MEKRLQNAIDLRKGRGKEISTSQGDRDSLSFFLSLSITLSLSFFDCLCAHVFSRTNHRGWGGTSFYVQLITYFFQQIRREEFQHAMSPAHENLIRQLRGFHKTQQKRMIEELMAFFCNL